MTARSIGLLSGSQRAAARDLLMRHHTRKVTSGTVRKSRELANSKMPQGILRYRRSWAVLLTLASLLALVAVGVVSRPVCAANKPPPNILLIVMDDIGIDQWQLFGYRMSSRIPAEADIKPPMILRE